MELRGQGLSAGQAVLHLQLRGRRPAEARSAALAAWRHCGRRSCTSTTPTPDDRRAADGAVRQVPHAGQHRRDGHRVLRPRGHQGEQSQLPLRHGLRDDPHSSTASAAFAARTAVTPCCRGSTSCWAWPPRRRRRWTRTSRRSSASSTRACSSAGSTSAGSCRSRGRRSIKQVGRKFLRKNMRLLRGLGSRRSARRSTSPCCKGSFPSARC